MEDAIAGTTPEGEEAQEGAAEAAATGTPAPKDEVTTLRSRNAGLDAKVTSLTQAQKDAQARADAAEAKLRDYEAGKVNADEALRAQLQAKEAELVTERQASALSRIEAKYPETFAVLGEAALNLSAEKLAEAEARFKGVADDDEAPQTKPIGNNPARTGAATTATTAAQRLADKEATFRTMTPPWLTD